MTASARHRKPGKQGKQGSAFNDGPDETFRGTMRGRTPDGEFTTLIVLRRGLGGAGRVWLTFDGAIRTTVVMTDGEADELVGLIGDAHDVR